MRASLLLCALATASAFHGPLLASRALARPSSVGSPPAALSRSVAPSSRVLASEGYVDDGGSPAAIAGAGGIFASLVCFVSEFTLKTTGCGLPAGPGGLYGAVEGISYLVIVGLIGWSLFTKVSTGKGLPAGPFGLLGAAEGLAYLAALAGLVVAGTTVLEYGGLPEAVPTDGGRCSNI
jgi:hypothetical protein